MSYCGYSCYCWYLQCTWTSSSATAKSTARLSCLVYFMTFLGRKSV